MRRLSTCCFCGSLKFGTVFTGVMGILLAIVTILLMFLTNLDFKTIVLDWLPPLVVTIILVINMVMTMLISLLLIIGALKRNTFMMLPWVVLGIMLGMALLVSVVYTTVVYILDGQVLYGCLMLVFGLIYDAIFLYLWVVVFSYFLELKEQDDRGRYSKAPYRRCSSCFCRDVLFAPMRRIDTDSCE